MTDYIRTAPVFDATGKTVTANGKVSVKISSADGSPYLAVTWDVSLPQCATKMAALPVSTQRRRWRRRLPFTGGLGASDAGDGVVPAGEGGGTLKVAD